MGKVKRLQATPTSRPRSKPKALQIGIKFYLLAIAAVTCLLLIWHYQIELGTIGEGAKKDLAFSVSGDWRNLTKRDLELHLTKLALPSFVGANVRVIKDHVETLPWVARAEVRKEWPNIIRVAISERQAVASWNEKWMLDAFGEKFLAKDDSDALPKLQGPEESLQEIVTGYDAIQKKVRTLGLMVKEIVVSERSAWTIILDNELKLILGREDLASRVDAFTRFYPALKEQHGHNLAYLDFRYETGIAVMPITSTETAPEAKMTGMGEDH